MGDGRLGISVDVEGRIVDKFMIGLVVKFIRIGSRTSHFQL